MKLIITKGKTSKLIEIFIQDNSVTTGAGLTGLVFNSGSLTCYYVRNGGSSASAVTLVTMTLGTWVSGGFKEIDATNMPGWYQFGIPDAVLATGADSAVLMFKGATNMAVVPIEIQLTSVDQQDAVRAGLSALPNASAGANGGLPTGNASGQVVMSSTANGAITSSSFASGAIDATAFAQGAADKVWSSAARTLTSFGTLIADIWANVTRTLTAGTNIVLAKGVGVTGFNDLSAAQVNTEVDTGLSDVGLTTTVTGRIDVAVSSRLAGGSYTTPPTVAQIRTEMDTNSTKLDVAVSSRLAAAGYTAPDNATISTIDTKLGTPSVSVSADIATRAPSATALSTAQWTNGRASNLDNLDTTVSSRSTLTAANVWAYVIEGALTAQGVFRLILASVANKLSGAATTTVSIRDLADTKNRIVATVDVDGNRSSVTVDAS